MRKQGLFPGRMERWELFFIVLINCNNKNATIAFYFCLSLSPVAARAFVQVDSRISPFFGMLHKMYLGKNLKLTKSGMEN